MSRFKWRHHKRCGGTLQSLPIKMLNDIDFLHDVQSFAVRSYFSSILAIFHCAYVVSTILLLPVKSHVIFQFTHPFLRCSDIYCSKIADLNLPHLYLAHPLGWCIRKLESLGYRMALFQLVCVILGLAIFVELRLVTDRQTHVTRIQHIPR